MVPRYTRVDREGFYRCIVEDTVHEKDVTLKLRGGYLSVPDGGGGDFDSPDNTGKIGYLFHFHSEILKTLIQYFSVTSQMKSKIL